MFKFRRNDSDILILPSKFAAEFHNLSPGIINGSHALFHNHLGYLAEMELMLESSLHQRAVHSNITLNLGNLLTTMKEEMEYTFSAELPKPTGEYIR